MSLIWVRDNPAADLASAKNTFSSWDACMSKTYCKWPVIAAIVIGSLIILSIVFCVARCICCGAECVCCCLSCCKGCCPSSSRGDSSGYRQAPSPIPPRYPPNNQYQSSVPPSYSPAPFYDRTPRTATFEEPSKSAAVHEDALPAMPSWSDARVKHVEEEVEHEPQDEEPDAVELERFDQSHTQQYAQQSPVAEREDNFPHQNNDHPYQNNDQPYQYTDRSYQNNDQYAYHEHDHYTAEQLGHNHSVANENAHYPLQQNDPYSMPYSQQASYPEYDNHYPPVSPQATYGDRSRSRASPRPQRQPAYQFNDIPPSVPPPVRSPVPSYGHAEPSRAPYQPRSPSPGHIPMPSSHSYAQTNSPPSYHTRPPSILSPGGRVTRKPTQDSWRNV